jgi:hypothetical protein
MKMIEKPLYYYNNTYNKKKGSDNPNRGEEYIMEATRKVCIALHLWGLLRNETGSLWRRKECGEVDGVHFREGCHIG